MSESCVTVVTTPSSSTTSNISGGNNVLVQQQKQMKIGDRVMAFDDVGGTVYGTVKWTSGSATHKIIGIETVSTFVWIHKLVFLNQAHAASTRLGF